MKMKVLENIRWLASKLDSDPRIVNYRIQAVYSHHIRNSLTNGRVFSNNVPSSAELSSYSLLFATKDNKVSSLSLSSLSPEGFDKLFEAAYQLRLSDTFPMPPKVITPVAVEMYDEQVASCLKDSNFDYLNELRANLERRSKVDSDKLLSVNCSTGMGESCRIFVNSHGAEYVDNETIVSGSIAYYTESGIEYGHRSLRTMLTTADEDIIEKDAKKHILLTDIRELAVDDAAKCTVVFDNRAFYSLFFDIIVPNLNGEAVLESSVKLTLADIGKKVIGSLTIIDDPTIPYGLSSYGFDDEGNAATKRHVFKDGVFVTPYLSQKVLERYPKELGMEPTGHTAGFKSTSASNLIVPGGSQSATELKEACRDYVLIDDLTGFTISPIDGQFILDATNALVVRDNKLQYLANFTISGNLFEILSDHNVRLSQEQETYGHYLPNLATSLVKLIPKRINK